MNEVIVENELRILMLEDVPVDAKLTEHALKKAGLQFAAKRVDARDDFIRALEEFAPDIILSDNNLPAFDGISALEIARNMRPDIPFVFVTGTMGDEEAAAAIKKGATDYVLKSHLFKLGIVVQRAIKEARERREGKLAHAKLRESEERFRLIVENAPFILGIIDSQKRVVFLNRRFREFFGYSMEDIPTLSAWAKKAYPDGEQRKQAGEQWHEDIRRLVDGNVSIPPLRTYQVTCAQGKIKYVEITFSILNDLTYVVFNDVTERKLAEEDLQKKNEELEKALDNLQKAQGMLVRNEKLAALGQLSAGVAHEIKNPLNIISTSVQLLMLERAMAPEEEHTYQTIMEQITRAVKITDNLRDFARIRKPETTAINLHDFIERTISLVEYEFKLDNVYFIRDFHASPITVKGDMDLLAQVFLNLINNGADSMKEKQRKLGRETLRQAGWKGDFSIKTTHDESWTYIHFSDTGTGMSPEVQRKIFDPFFTTKSEGKGTGLGLSIAMGLVENHGGSILVESAEGAGSTFTVKLPYTSNGN